MRLLMALAIVSICCSIIAAHFWWPRLSRFLVHTASAFFAAYLIAYLRKIL